MIRLDDELPPTEGRPFPANRIPAQTRSGIRVCPRTEQRSLQLFRRCRGNELAHELQKMLVAGAADRTESRIRHVSLFFDRFAGEAGGKVSPTSAGGPLFGGGERVQPVLCGRQL